LSIDGSDPKKFLLNSSREREKDMSCLLPLSGPPSTANVFASNAGQLLQTCRAKPEPAADQIEERDRVLQRQPAPVVQYGG